MPYVNTEVYVKLDEFDDDDLAEELESRGHKVILNDEQEDNRLKDELFELLKSWICDPEATFNRNMRIFSNRWYMELRK